MLTDKALQARNALARERAIQYLGEKWVLANPARRDPATPQTKSTNSTNRASAAPTDAAVSLLTAWRNGRHAQ